MRGTRWLKNFFAVCTTLTVLLTGVTRAKDGTSVLAQIQETILDVRMTKGPSMDRTNAAERLSQLTKRVAPNEVDDKTLADLVSLLDINDDSVRGWVAGALGYLGPRAKLAVPALLKVTHETDCIQLREMTSAGAARLALKRIGVTPPTAHCGTQR